MCQKEQPFLEVAKQLRELLNCLWKIVSSQFQKGFIKGSSERLEVGEILPFWPSCGVWDWARALDEGGDWGVRLCKYKPN